MDIARAGADFYVRAAVSGALPLECDICCAAIDSHPVEGSFQARAIYKDLFQARSKLPTMSQLWQCWLLTLPCSPANTVADLAASQAQLLV